MTVYSCDRCGQRVAESWDLQRLNEDYQVDGITEICRPCMKAINQALSDARDFYMPLIDQRVIDFVAQKGKPT